MFRLVVRTPFAVGDVFEFSSTAASVDPDLARSAFETEEPYVVPNPYVGASSFEPERFAQAGRGERRIEFRAVPASATIRIYTVTGELVQTLRHDGMATGRRRVGPPHEGPARGGPGPLRLPRRRRGRRRVGRQVRRHQVARRAPPWPAPPPAPPSPRSASGRPRSSCSSRRAGRAAQSKTGTTIFKFLQVEPSARVAAQGNAGATGPRGGRSTPTTTRAPSASWPRPRPGSRTARGSPASTTTTPPSP